MEKGRWKRERGNGNDEIKEREFGKKERRKDILTVTEQIYICKILNNYRVLTSRKYQESTEGRRPYVPALK